MSQQILDEYISRPQLAERLGKSENTLARWQREQIGPPITFIGRDPYYKIQSVQKWLRTREHSFQHAGALNVPKAKTVANPF